MTTTLHLLVPDDAYHADIKVAFTDLYTAEEHQARLAETGVGATVVPIQMLDELPESRPWWLFVTTIRPNGIIQRRDIHQNVEWSYENTVADNQDPIHIINPSSSDPRAHIVKTIGYNFGRAKAEHDEQVEKLGGFSI